MAFFVRSNHTIPYRNTYNLSSSLYYNQHRTFLNLQLGKKFKNWMKNSDDRSNTKAWYGEARRFLEHQEYTLYAFDAHLRTTVDSYDKAGPGRRLFRRGMKYFNKDADDYQRKMVDESRQILHILDTFPKEGFNDPEKYFKGLNKSKLAMETKLQTSDVGGILDKFQNQKTTHKLLKDTVSKGYDLPTSQKDMQIELSKPAHVVPKLREAQEFGGSNPNRKNEIYDKYIEEWNHKVWLSPYRLRQRYRWKKGWKKRDWRQYQPKWIEKENIDFDINEYNNGAKKKLYPENYKRQEKIRYSKPGWMKRWSWRQNGDRLIELKHNHYNGIGKHIDLYNYDRVRNIYDKTDMKDRITKAPKYGGNMRGYHH